ncbi:MAG: nitrile hydratase subunit beta [Alphaproteobacteria bacterium]|nr:nitrile hydratase subunit beta [Alphaproteobacteria bacterium]
MPEEAAGGPRNYHDLGGLAAGTVTPDEHTLEPWEKRVDVLRVLLGKEPHRIMRVDELRNAIETIGEDVYRSHSYYQLWMAAIIKVVTEKGILSRAEIEQRIATVGRRLGVAVKP